MEEGMGMETSSSSSSSSSPSSTTLLEGSVVTKKQRVDEALPPVHMSTEDLSAASELMRRSSAASLQHILAFTPTPPYHLKTLYDISLLPQPFLQLLLCYLDLKSLLRFAQTNKFFHRMVMDNEPLWKRYYEAWCGPVPLQMRSRKHKRDKLRFRDMLKQTVTEMPAGAMSELLDVVLYPERDKKPVGAPLDDDEVDDEDDLEMRQSCVWGVFGIPRNHTFTFKFKGKLQQNVYTGWASKYYEHWVVSPVPVPREVLDVATMTCYEHLRDRFQVTFEEELYEDVSDEDESIAIRGARGREQKIRTTTPEDAYMELERLGIWVVRNYWPFERPPMQGPQPGDAQYVLTFNNEWSEHYMWCTVDPASNAVFFDAIRV